MEEYEFTVKIRTRCESKKQAELICESIELNEPEQVIEFMGLPCCDLNIIDVKAELKKL